MGSDISSGYPVRWQKDDLISIEFTVRSYRRRRPFQIPTQKCQLDLKNGKLLKLADLFLPGSNTCKPYRRIAFRT